MLNPPEKNDEKPPENKVVPMLGGMIPEGACPNENVLKVLKEALEIAESGDMSMVAIAWTTPGGRGKWDWSAGQGRLALIGTIDGLHNDIVNEAIVD